MKRKDVRIISEKVAILQGEILRSVTRAGSMASWGFGDDVVRQVHRYDENRELAPTMESAPGLALHIDGTFRLICGNEIVLSKGDMFEPSTKKQNEPDFDWETFSWDIQGGNRFDEINAHYFREEAHDFVVKKISVSQWGDLKIQFGNGFTLETFTDSSGSEECWRFFKVGDDDHLVVTGCGIEDAEESEEDKE